jgi:hypothetical protein
MSYDLEVYLQGELPLSRAVESVGREDVVATAEWSDPEGSGLSLVRRTKRTERQLCTADGPLRIDEDDDHVPDAVRASLLSVGWTVQISRPFDLARTDASLVERFTRAVADEGKGVVYDPQLAKIVWPRNVKKLRDVPPASQPGPEHVALEWLFARRLTSADADALLAVIEQRMPEAMPHRFGTFEPPQGRLERDGKAAFSALFDDVDDLFWKGKRPFQWGFVNLRRGWGSALTQAERDARTPTLGGRKGVSPDSIRMEFQPELATDERWLQAISSLFRAVARELKPFFAGGYLDRGSFENPQHLAGAHWLGIPPEPLWLTWVGSPYLAELPTEIPARSERTDEFLFVSAGKSPKDREALRSGALAWEPRLRRTGTQLQEELAAAFIPELR